MREIKKCSECEHCKEFRKSGNTRSGFHCEHPDKKYIWDYYKEHNINRMVGFIGFGAKYSNDVPLKTSPAWCPLKRS